MEFKKIVLNTAIVLTLLSNTQYASAETEESHLQASNVNNISANQNVAYVEDKKTVVNILKILL